MRRLSIVGISGNLTRPSRTRTLVEAVLAEARRRGLGETRAFDIVDAGPGIGASLSREGATAEVDRVLTAIEQADVVIAGSPVYKASYTGLFKHLFDLLDPKCLQGRPVVLAATGGSDRHALVVDHQLRPLFGFFGAHILPVSLYAANTDFISSGEMAPGYLPRIARAVDQLGILSAGQITNRVALVQNVA